MEARVYVCDNDRLFARAKGALSMRARGTAPGKRIASGPALKARINARTLPYKFFSAQLPMRSRAFSMFSIELATLKRR